MDGDATVPLPFLISIPLDSYRCACINRLKSVVRGYLWDIFAEEDIPLGQPFFKRKHQIESLAID